MLYDLEYYLYEDEDEDEDEDEEEEWIDYDE